MIPYWWFCAKPFLNLFLGDSHCSQDPGSLSLASKILLFLRVPTGVSLQPKRCIKDGVSSSAAQLCSFVRGLAWCWQVCTGPACWRLSRMNVPSTPWLFCCIAFRSILMGFQRTSGRFSLARGVWVCLFYWGAVDFSSASIIFPWLLAWVRYLLSRRQMGEGLYGAGGRLSGRHSWSRTWWVGCGSHPWASCRDYWVEDAICVEMKVSMALWVDGSSWLWLLVESELW